MSPPCPADALPSSVKILDDRLEIAIFVPSPKIRTPIGMVIDAQDRIFVIESHTHHPRKDYPGPEGDIIKLYRDRDFDGIVDSEVSFAEDIHQAMNLALSPDGVLYAVCAREVWAFYDENEDDRCERRERILHVDTPNSYAHSCQLGIAFSNDHWLYISRGNNGSSPYAVIGTDASRVEGFGDGGNIYRCRPDGSRVQEVATGFWNPFDIRFDTYGRLLALDSDPDARGPNRLVHVVEEGDYGHKSIFGGGGNHPYQGWDGTLPGTLPYVAGVGEAPCGLLDCNRAALPNDYRDHYWAAIWNENTIVRLVPQRQGVSIVATSEPLITGDDDFRPVAMDADSRGNVFITDWVKVAYPNHGEGRIWRVSAKQKDGLLQPRPWYAPYKKDPGREAMESLKSVRKSAGSDAWIKGLASADAFVQHASILGLARHGDANFLQRMLEHPSSRVRIGVMLALRRLPELDLGHIIRPLLADPDHEVRRLALMWAGEEGVMELRPDVFRALDVEDPSPLLFETVIATLEVLDADFIEKCASRQGKAARIKRGDARPALLNILKDDARSPRVRALSLIQLGPIKDDETSRLIARLAKQSPAFIQREALRSLAESNRDYSDLFYEIAGDDAQPASSRAEALLALANFPLDDPQRLLAFLEDDDPTVTYEAARTMALNVDHPDIKNAFETRLKADNVKSDPTKLSELMRYALALLTGTEGQDKTRPSTVAAWEAALATGGDPEAGERVFFSAQTQCATCHRVRNRGRRIGPELSNLGQSLSRQQIIHSIVKPSDQYPPQYQAWFVELKDGITYMGLQLDHKSGGDIELYTTEGITRHFEAEEIEGYGVLENSLMPDGLEATMTVEEFRDLVAFLERSKP